MHLRTQTPPLNVAVDQPTPEAVLSVTPAEAARRLSVSRTMLFSLIGGDRPELRSFLIGERTRLIPVAELESFIQRRIAA